ncbi:MAG: M50 family metallopeptidase [Chloroflexi bacterium]|nr:M50 family metallopeptidase [Chloroflexota bacterium]
MTEQVQQPEEMNHPALVASALLASAIIVYLIWNVADFVFILYPLRLFSTLVHEMSHSIVAVITGGEVTQFVVNTDHSGYALVRGGYMPLIASAGYLGTALFGSIVFYANNRFRHANSVAFMMGLSIVVVTLIYANPILSGHFAALIVALAFGIGLMVLGWKAPMWPNLLVVNVIATITALDAVNGALTLARFTQETHHNDAVIFWRVATPWLPSPNIVAWAWAAMAITMFGMAFYYGVFTTFVPRKQQPSPKQIKQPVDVEIV